MKFNELDTSPIMEVNMSPSSLQQSIDKIAGTPMVGVEFEFIIPHDNVNTYSNNHDDDIDDYMSTDDLLNVFYEDDANVVISNYESWLEDEEANYVSDESHRINGTPDELEDEKIEIITGLDIYQDEDVVKWILEIKDEEYIEEEGYIDEELAKDIINNAQGYYKEYGNAKLWFTNGNEKQEDELFENPYALLYHVIFIENADYALDRVEEIIAEEFRDSEMYHNERHYSLGHYLQEVHNCSSFQDIANRFDLSYESEYDEMGGSRFEDAMQELLYDDLDDLTEHPVRIFGDYHANGGSSDGSYWKIEPDTSISGDGIGVELVTPILPYDSAFSTLSSVFDIIKSQDGFTNSSTGLHINISVDGIDHNTVDYIKLIILLGDQHILKEFNRINNTYSSSSFGKLSTTLGSNETENILKSIDNIRSGMNTNVQELLTSGSFNYGKFTSIGLKSNRIEFRSVGNDYIDDYPKIVNAINRFIVVYSIAANPNAYKKEYAKKLYKLLLTSNETANPDSINIFSKYTSGVYNMSDVKYHLKGLQSNRALNKSIIPDDTDEAVHKAMAKYNLPADVVISAFKMGVKQEVKMNTKTEKIWETVRTNLMNNINFYGKIQ